MAEFLVRITWESGATAELSLTDEAIEFYKSIGVSVESVVPEVPIIAPEPVITTAPFQPKIPSTLDPLPSQPGMVTISPGVFQIINDRLAGEVLYIASPNFFEAEKRARALMQIKTTNGTVLVIKENALNFTQSQPDERIFFNEGAFGEQELEIELFVWDEKNIALASSKVFRVKPLEITTPQPFRPPRGKIESTFGKIIAGVFIGGVALAFIKGAKK